MNKGRGRRTLTAGVLLATAVLLTVAMGVSIAGAHADPVKGPKPAAKAWSFGVMGDTQWTCPT